MSPWIIYKKEFASKVPQGSYKILAKRFDGLFKSAFYDADDNGEVEVVTIDGNLTGIDFVLESRPSATVTIKLLDVTFVNLSNTHGLISSTQKMSTLQSSFQTWKCD